MTSVKKCLTPGSVGPGSMSLVPEIYVTPTETDKPSIAGSSSGRRDSTNSNLSSSMPNLAIDDLTDSDFTDNGKDTPTKPKDLSIYCSPRPSRRACEGNGSGPKQKYHAHNGHPNYPFLKCVGKPRRDRHESTDSNDSDCSASHQSTCATSDYTHLTSLDMINILSIRDQYHQGLGSNMDVSEFGTLRRTHSNPENCMLTPEETTTVMENSDTSLRDSKSCTNLEAQVVPPVLGSHGNQLKPEAQRPTQLVQTGSGNDINTQLLHAGDKELAPAVSEENLLIRVNRWLSTVEGDEQKVQDSPKS